MVLVHGRLRIGGTLFNDANWSIGVNFLSGQGSDPFANLNTDVPGSLRNFLTAVRSQYQNQVLPGAMLGALSQAGKITYLRASRVGTNGRESDVAQIDLATPVPGTGAAIHPAQTAIVLSLQTGAPGARNRGRLYLPGLGLTLQGGRVGVNDLGQLTIDAADFIKQLRSSGDALAGGGVTGVAYPSVVSTVASGGRNVTSVRVGNRLDSQRRRAESEKEVYSVASVTQ